VTITLVVMNSFSRMPTFANGKVKGNASQVLARLRRLAKKENRGLGSIPDAGGHIR
jgi:hypothetical protein